VSELIDRIAALPIWQGLPTIEPLVGGLSNLSFVVRDASGKYAVRTGEDFAFHNVIRERELMTARAAHAAGFAPEVVFAEPGIVVSRFVEGRVFGPADVRADIGRIAAMLRRFHADMPAVVSETGYAFGCFAAIRDYVEALRESANPVARARIGDALAIATELEGAQVALPPVFGHNDLLPANILDDGARLWLIDFEYSGCATPLFDLANLSSNACFDAGQSDELLRAYYGGDPGADVRRAHGAMECASLLREALWSLVSEMHLDAPGADYEGYAQYNFERYDAVLAGYRARFGG